MSIRRGVIPSVDHFTIVPNHWLRDVRLTRKARGLLAELISHRPGWETSIERLVDGGPEGRDAIRTALVELETYGYLVRSRERDEGGRLAGTDYEVRDPGPTSDEPTSDNPTQAEPTLDNPTPKKTIPQKTIEKNSATAEPSVIERAFDVFWGEYPKKVDKIAAKKAFVKALKIAKSPAPIMEGLRRYRFPEDRQYVKNPATWLNAGSWMNEPDQAGGSAPAKKLNSWEL